MPELPPQATVTLEAGVPEKVDVMTSPPRGVDLGSERRMPAAEDGAFQIETHDVARTDVVLRTTDREEATRVLVPRIVPVVRGRSSLRAVDADGLVEAR